jgi:sulfite reductase (NADPH) hemoprotein beta-component
VAACGDDNRNVIATANPLLTRAHAAASELARRIGERLLPRTGAYGEVFLGREPEPVALESEEPLYGPTYLPRKFKVAIAVPPSNDIDVFAHDLGLVAIVGSDGEIRGYNVCVGGGMGMTHNVPATFPRLSDPIGLCRAEDALAVAEHTLCIQRDFGNRKDRAHARFKYTIEDRGADWFRSELERRLGRALEPAAPMRFDTSADRFGWQRGDDGRWHYTLFVPGGRVVDRPGAAFATGLRAIAAAHPGIFALTTNQNLVIAGVTDHDRPAIEQLLAAHGIVNDTHSSPLRRSAIACVALPTCGLAMAESERYLPELLARFEDALAEAGLTDAPISLRVSGCPNGCSRPYVAEIALVGKAPGKYNLYLGGSASGERLNALYRETATEAQILDALRPLLHRYAAQRHDGESFGDFVVRVGVVRAVRAGRDFNRPAA